MNDAKLRVMTVFGTRPDTIKMAPVVHALRADDRIDDVICATAQRSNRISILTS
jgi:UDP-N-acetylglucosamine 2-epimerase (non-hydrolysing)